MKDHVKDMVLLSRGVLQKRKKNIRQQFVVMVLFSLIFINYGAADNLN